MLFRLEPEDDPGKKKLQLVPFTHAPTIHMQEIEYCLDDGGCLFFVLHFTISIIYCRNIYRHLIEVPCAG